MKNKVIDLGEIVFPGLLCRHARRLVCPAVSVTVLSLTHCWSPVRAAKWYSNRTQKVIDAAAEQVRAVFLPSATRACQERLRIVIALYVPTHFPFLYE